MIKKIDQWSYSRYGDYTTCPAKAKYKHLDKIKEPANPAMERGSLIHKEAEIYVEAQQDKMPDSLTKCASYFDEMADADMVFTERKMAMTRDWKITDFFADDCWVRMILDLMFKIDDTLVIVDYKTGRQRPTHRDQLSLYAIAGFAEFGNSIKEVDAEIWYLDHGEQMTDTVGTLVGRPPTSPWWPVGVGGLAHRNHQMRAPGVRLPASVLTTSLGVIAKLRLCL